MTPKQWKMVIGAIILAALVGISMYTGTDLTALIKSLGEVEQIVGEM